MQLDPCIGRHVLCADVVPVGEGGISEGSCGTVLVGVYVIYRHTTIFSILSMILNDT
jgi:hypothetical protein